jgi:hypothetical protein
MGGLALTALGVLTLIWSFLCAIIGQIRVIGPSVREREVVRIVPEHDDVWPERNHEWVEKKS